MTVRTGGWVPGSTGRREAPGQSSRVGPAAWSFFSLSAVWMLECGRRRGCDQGAGGQVSSKKGREGKRSWGPTRNSPQGAAGSQLVKEEG